MKKNAKLGFSNYEVGEEDKMRMVSSRSVVKNLIRSLKAARSKVIQTTLQLICTNIPHLNAHCPQLSPH